MVWREIAGGMKSNSRQRIQSHRPLQVTATGEAPRPDTAIPLPDLFETVPPKALASLLHPFQATQGLATDPDRPASSYSQYIRKLLYLRRFDHDGRLGVLWSGRAAMRRPGGGVAKQYGICYIVNMARGHSGRVVTQVELAAEDTLRAVLAKDKLTLGDWFVRNTATCLHRHGSLPRSANLADSL